MLPTPENEKIFNLYCEMAFGIANSPNNQHKITKNELVMIIKTAEKQHKGTNFFSLTQVTRVQSRKIPDVPVIVLPGLKIGKTQLVKVSQVNGIFGANYADKVNKAREQEGKAADFVAQASRYNAVEDSKIFEEKDGSLYIRYMPVSTSKAFPPKVLKPVDANGSEFAPVQKADVEQYIQTASAGFYQGLDKGVEIRKISLNSIAAININGKEYAISDLDDIRTSAWAASGTPMPQPPEQE